jgi:hypothetical protein
MKIVPFIVTFNSMSTGPRLNQCVDFLMTNASPSFGTAIEQIDLYARCQTKDNIPDGLEFLMDRFQKGLTTLPYIRFRRKLRLFEISYESRWVHSSDFFKENGSEFSRSDFDAICREFATSLALVRRRIKKTDDFDVGSFEGHLLRRIDCLNEPICVQSFWNTNKAEF